VHLRVLFKTQKRNKMKKEEKLTGSAMRQCSSSWSATVGKVARSNFKSIDRNLDRSLLESIDRFSVEKKNARKIHKNKS